MAASREPVFALTPNCFTAVSAAANTGSDGSGALVTIFTAGTNGSRLDDVVVINAQLTAAASSAMVVRLFVTDTAGANPRLFDEQAMVTATRSTTVIGSKITFAYAGGLHIASGQLVKMCQSVYASAADQNHVRARGGDF